MDRKPYCYCITDTLTGRRYYGARYRKGCHPDDLGTIYFSSSRIIFNLIKERGGYKSFTFEVRKTFDTPEACLAWEYKVLCRLGIPKNKAWYNLKSAGGYAYENGKATETHKLKNSESHKGQKAWNKGRPRTEEEKQKISEATKAAMAARPLTPEQRAKQLANTRRGTNHPIYGGHSSTAIENMRTAQRARHAKQL